MVKRECVVSGERQRMILKELKQGKARDIYISGSQFGVIMLNDISGLTERYFVDGRNGNKYGYVLIEKIARISTKEVFYSE
jgi:hypothetical protein